MITNHCQQTALNFKKVHVPIKKNHGWWVPTLIQPEKVRKGISCKNVSLHRAQRSQPLLDHQIVVFRLFPSSGAHQLWDSPRTVWWLHHSTLFP